MEPGFTDIFLMSLEGLGLQFINFFEDRKTRVVTISNNGHMRAMLRKYKELEFPYFALQMQTAELNRDGLAPKNLQRTGVLGAMDETKSYRHKFFFSPVTVGVRVVFCAQDVKDIYEFVQQWLYAVTSQELKYELEADTFTVPINLELEENLSVPELENEDVGEIFMLETTIRVRTFVGKVEKRMIIRNARSIFTAEGENTTNLDREVRKTSEFSPIERTP